MLSYFFLNVHLHKKECRFVYDQVYKSALAVPSMFKKYDAEKKKACFHYLQNLRYAPFTPEEAKMMKNIWYFFYRIFLMSQVAFD